MAGINTIADAVKPTLGPTPRHVGIEANLRDRPPELLDDGGTIARRVIQLPDPAADAGAMLLRHALWRMREECGDGTATLAVMAQSLMRHAARAMAAGAHPALLKRGIERAAERAIEHLRARAVRFPSGAEGRAMLAGLAASLCHDAELRDVLVEAVDIVGAEGAIQIDNADGRRVERDYVEGALWDSAWLAGGFATEIGRVMARIEDAAVVVLDGRLDNTAHVYEGLGRLHEAGISRLMLVADDATDEATSVLLQARHSGVFKLLPVKAPGLGDARALARQDLATLTGARIVFGGGAGFAKISPDSLGEVRRAWATARQFGVVGGRRDPHALRAAIRDARKRMAETKELGELGEARLRLGRLRGGVALVRVGSTTAKLQQARKDEAIRLSSALQMALRQGVVAGGGAALFHAGESLRAEADARERDDEAWGARCLARALAAPLEVIVANAGDDPSAVAGMLRAARKKDSRLGFDARRHAIADMPAAGIFDSAEIAERAVRGAASAIGMALTTDALVLKRAPAISANP